MKATANWVVIVASAVVALGLQGRTFAETVELPPSGEEMKAAEAIAAEVEQEKALKEQERKIEAQKRYESASDALREGKYDLAISELTAALAADPDNDEYKELLKRAKIMQISSVLKSEDFTQAKDLCDQFLVDYPGDEQVLLFKEQAIAALENPPAPPEEEKPPVSAEVLAPTADQLLQEADDLLRKKDYKLAMDKLLDARELSPYDIRIDKQINRLEKELTRYERAFSDAVRQELLTQIEQAWSRKPRRVVTYVGPEVGPAVEPPSKAREDILRKLEVMIPEVKFEDAKLTEVVDFLSREAGVNIVIDPVVFQGGYSQPTSGVGTTPGVPGGFPTTPGGPTTPPSGMPGPGGTTFPTGMEPLPGMPSPAGAPGITDTTSPLGGTYIPPVTDTGITVRLRNVPLKEVLKYVLKWKNLKYVVEDYAILIAPVDYVPPESLETHIFRLATTGIGIIDRPDLTTTLSGPAEPGTGAPSDYVGLPGTDGGATSTETVREFLAQSGVPWPMGSNIIYSSRTGTLIVTNTPTNMVLIRQLVDLWDQPALQVEIESRFVEILVTRFFENSFEIDMLSPLIFTEKAAGGPVPAGVRKSVGLEAHPSRGTRYFPQLLPLEFPTPDADSIFSITGIMTNPDFQFTWRAINQRDWSDLLSAPRITTISGQQAQIEVVQ
jgi:tetratricopeptide (TPR) repeat protein